LTKVAVLGTGIMGSALARNLLRAGLGVIVWNRTRAKAEPLTSDGAKVANTPAEAAASSEIVLTMLTDWDAVDSAMTGLDGALSGMSENGIWLQMGTIGIAATERAAELAEEAGVILVDAPVSGTKEPAEKGELVVIAAGPASAVDTCQPVFDAVGQKTVRVGAEPGRASAFKLVLNTWLIELVESLAETIVLARTLAFEPELFLETISGGPLDSSYAQLKGKEMSQEEFPPSFPVRLARKDASLVVQEAERRELDLPAIRAALNQLERAEELGLGDQDLAAVYQAVRRGLERPA
jgi:3-hydroxyisobutyrate dehydrogenase